MTELHCFWYRSLVWRFVQPGLQAWSMRGEAILANATAGRNASDETGLTLHLQYMLPNMPILSDLLIL